MAKSRYTKNIKLTDRDRACFEMIGKRGCVTLEAIHRNYWTSARKETCEARIDQLVKGSFLKSEFVDVRGKQEKIYYLARKARNEFDQETRKTFYKKRPAMNELRHALYMSDVLDAFSSRVARFVNEHQLKSINSRLAEPLKEVPDASVSLVDVSGFELSFDIEIDGAYYGKNLARKLANLASSNRLTLWVSWSKPRVEHIRSLIGDTSRIIPMYFNDLVHL